MTTPTDWIFQCAEAEAAWTQAELGEDGWPLYQELMGTAGPPTLSPPGGTAGAAPPPSGAAVAPNTPVAAPAPPGADPGAAAPTQPSALGMESPSGASEAAPAPPGDDADAATPLGDPPASPAIVWPAMRYLSAELVGQFVTEMLALDPPGLTRHRVNGWLKARGCPHEEGIVRKGLLNWLRAAGVLENPNTGLPPRLTETDLATIAQRLAATPYHADMERTQ